MPGVGQAIKGIHGSEDQAIKKNLYFMYQDFVFCCFVFRFLLFKIFFSVNSLEKKMTHQENKTEIGFLN